MSKTPTSLLTFDSPAFGGPFGINAPLFTDIAAVPYEGLWTPLIGAKSASLEINGSMSTLSVQLYGSNVQSPLNGYIVTVAGSIQADDVCAITFNSPNLPNATAITKSYTVLGGDSVTIIAAALVALIKADVNLASLGLLVSSVAGVITVTFPSVFTGAGSSSPSQIKGNTLLVTTLVTGNTPTETMAVTLPSTGIALGSAITTLSLAALTIIPRYIKARVSTLTGTNATVTGNLQASA